MQEWVSIIVTHSTDPHAAVRAVMDPGASSSAPVGSSAKTTLGSIVSARAIEAR